MPCDHDRNLLVDVELEPDLGPGPDATQQRRAGNVEGLAERGAILARWSAGAWHDLQICPEEDAVKRKRIRVPPRCTLLLARYAGKPHPARIERPGEVACVVAVNPGRRPLALDVSIPPPAKGETRKHFRTGTGASFPACIAPQSAVRLRYQLIGEWAKAWHVDHNFVLTRESKTKCPAGH